MVSFEKSDALRVWRRVDEVETGWRASRECVAKELGFGISTEKISDWRLRNLVVSMERCISTSASSVRA